ncbi:TetR/AcrR family transcriptional regulator, partial [Anaerostipes sp.]
MNTKQKILLESLRLFSQRGYDAVSVEQIAAAVGIKAPSLYKHYKSKQEIFDAIFEETARRYEDFTDT